MAVSALFSTGSTRTCPRSFQSQAAQPLRPRACRQTFQARLVVRASREDDLAELTELRGGVSAALAEKERSLREGGSSVNAAAGDAGNQPGDIGLPDLQELTSDDFRDYLSSSNNLIVVDFFTDWCGPCKVMYPMLQKMAEEHKPDVSFVKFNCNKQNKELGKELGVKVAPTFHLYKNSEKLDEMTGAKVEALQELIAKHK